MSRIGEKPIEFTNSTEIEIKEDLCLIKGKEGALSILIPSRIKVEKKDSQLLVRRESDDKKVKALHGLVRSLIKNAVLGVNKLWQRRLEVVGTGYRVKRQGENLFFEIGFSHPVKFEKVEEVNLEVKGANKVIVSGVDRQKVGEVAARIRRLKKPDPYKGKGIRYEGEKLKLKPGKKVKGLGEVE